MSQDRDAVKIDEAVRRFVENLRASRFFGVVELHFQDGHLMRVKKSEVLQPGELLQLTSK